MNNKDIHAFALHDLNILLDVNSGSVHVVDDATKRVMEIYDGNNIEQVSQQLTGEIGEAQLGDILNQLKDIQAAGQLFSREVQVTEAFDQPAIVKSLCLHIAHDCNLRCGYCFAGTGAFGGGRSMMTIEVGCRAVDFLIEHSGSRKFCEMDFFGGEPLMNFDVVRQVVDYARKREVETGKIFRLTLTTNAMLLNDSIIQFLNDQNISIVLSIDGRKEVNDRMRPACGGQGSYDTIVKNIKKTVESRNNQNYYVRGTYTRYNTDFAADVLHMADLGLTELSVEPVVAQNEPYALTEEDLPTLYGEYEKLAKEYVNRQEQGCGFNFFHFNVDIEHGPCVIRRLSGCGAGHEYFAVTPEGDLYPCHQFVGNPEFKVGTIFEGVVKPEISQEFRQTHIYNKQDCPDCWARFYCSGGCHANAEAFHATLTKPYELGCHLQRKRIECALYVQAKRMMAELAK